MKSRLLRKCLIPLAVAGFSMACNEGDKDNPATESRSDLNPPRGLTSVTWDKKIELRFETGNAEDDFQGYHVFGAKCKDGSTGPTDCVTAPTWLPPGVTTANWWSANIPRCVDNNAFFAQFGITAASEAACEADATSDTTAGTDTGGGDTDAMFLQDDGSAGGDTAAALTGILKCVDGSTATGTDISMDLSAKGQSLEQQVCVVDTVANVAMANGQRYMFFVAAVLGEDKNKISWTSNFVSDTPATQVFSDTLKIPYNAALRLDASKIGAAGNAVSLYGDDFLALADIAPITAADFVAETCADTGSAGFCKINRKNTSATTDGVYIGRGTNSSYPQRFFFSAPAGKQIQYQLRGPVTYDPRKDPSVIATSTPGDQAATADSTYDTTGTLIPVYGNQVFDVRVKNGADWYYGKFVFEEPVLADATNGQSEISVKVTLLMQSDANNPDYLQ